MKCKHYKVKKKTLVVYDHKGQYAGYKNQYTCNTCEMVLNPTIKKEAA